MAGNQRDVNERPIRMRKMLVVLLLSVLVLGAAACSDGDPVVAPDSAADNVLIPDSNVVGEQTSKEPANGEVRLFVSNQSFDDDPVQISISVDGIEVVDDAFEVLDQHHFVGFIIRGLDPGPHTITAVSGTGASMEGTFTSFADEPRWLSMNYWYYPATGEGRHFSLTEEAEPIEFA